ncbi:flagellar basal body-associated protein FliL [Ligilactobacillus salitolerans]|uniref:Flagellar protein FliL n=1 Tax=Ligilactobacillus salitolerans TaxID=1808352 RepID=A0A401ITS6_9LACO|nr:flagellar basal body-associated FliL family protein [Ligilactobacillus salitolerans]GBG94924.1 flagellar basal body-associated protein FliL [Ligilactobacillus salitolerans]
MKNKAERENTENKKGGVKWGLIIVLVVVLAFAASAAGTMLTGKYFSKDDNTAGNETEAKTTAISSKQRLVSVDKFVVNLANDGNSDPQYLRIKVSLLVPDGDDAKDIKKHMPLIRDSMIRVLKPKKAADLLKDDGSIDQIKTQVKDALNKDYGHSVVQEVYVTDFVIQ